jgi:hypothetical protein
MTSDAPAREFDLNIERVLENWTVVHALREVIANALDEQAPRCLHPHVWFRTSPPLSPTFTSDSSPRRGLATSASSSDSAGARLGSCSGPHWPGRTPMDVTDTSVTAG